MTSMPQPSINVTCPQGCGRVLRTRQGLRRHLRSVHGIVEAERVCTKCGKSKEAGCFGIVDSTTTSEGRVVFKYRSACDECRGLERRKERPESHKRRDRKKGIARRFGLTVEQYDLIWKKLTLKQRGHCAVCRTRPLVCLDHQHATGELRGLLCRQCNLAAGYVMDDPKIAERLARYLKGGQ